MFAAPGQQVFGTPGTSLTQRTNQAPNGRVPSLGGRGVQRGIDYMKHSCFVVLALVLGLGFGPAYGQDEAATKQADIKKLLGITGASNTGLRVFSQVIGMFQRAHSEVPEAVWMEMVSEAEAKVDGFVMEMLVPIYDKHLTHEDIKGLIAFYETPVGRKLLAVMPRMHQESRTAGEIWGRDFARTVQERLAEKGYE